MKKLIMFGLVLSVVFVAFSSCDIAEIDDEFSYLVLPSGNKTTLNVQYFRTDDLYNIIEFPYSNMVAILSSRVELEQYCLDRKNKLEQYFFENYGWDYSVNSILNLFEKYNDNFFKDNYLAIVGLVEGSGSIRHKVEKIDKNGNIYIKRLLPGIGTCDMAGWSIVIELTNASKFNNFQVKVVDKKLY